MVIDFLLIELVFIYNGDWFSGNRQKIVNLECSDKAVQTSDRSYASVRPSLMWCRFGPLEGRRGFGLFSSLMVELKT